MARLYFVDISGSEAWVDIGPDQREVVIGRLKDCQIKTKNNTVSRRHCKVVWEEGAYRVVDLKSSNGTFYSGQRVDECSVTDGDVFFCGNFKLRIEVEQDDAEELDFSDEDIISLDDLEIEEEPQAEEDGEAPALVDEGSHVNEDFPEEAPVPVLAEPEHSANPLDAAPSSETSEVLDVGEPDNQEAPADGTHDSLKAKITELEGELELRAIEMASLKDALSEMSDLEHQIAGLEARNKGLSTELDEMSAMGQALKALEANNADLRKELEQREQKSLTEAQTAQETEDKTEELRKTHDSYTCVS